MKLTIQTHGMELTDWLQEYVEKKFGRLERYLPDITEIRVELREEQTRAAADRQIAQVTVHSLRTILRAEERSGDMFASIDAVADKLERRIERYKGKSARNSKRAVMQATAVSEAVLTPPAEAEEETQNGRIVRVKAFEIQPMDSVEAIDQMELLGHDFYVYQDAISGAVNVVYRRRDGDYGLLQPELM